MVMNRNYVFLYLRLLKIVKIALSLLLSLCAVAFTLRNNFNLAMIYSVTALVVLVSSHQAEIIFQRRAQIALATKSWEISVVLAILVFCLYSLGRSSLMRLADNRHDAIRFLADAPMWVVWVSFGIFFVLGFLLQFRNRKHTLT
jgi:hypothetical protein